MHPAILSRLLSARFLLENSGRSLNAHSDAREVANAVLAAHNAAELTLSAVADHLQVKVTERATFIELIEKLDGSGRFSQGLPEKLFLNRLNTPRITFKHKGELPNVGDWFGVIGSTTHSLNEICKESLGIRLTEVDTLTLVKDSKTLDTLTLVKDSKTQALIHTARTQRAQGQFKEALESLAKALYRANLSFPVGLHIVPGEADASLALILSGYGIDPSVFIVLQQLLPSLDGKKLEWTLHQTGHEANWNDDNVKFCSESLVRLILTLQDARPRPQPLKFDDVYQDVVTISTDKPHIHRIHLLSAPDSQVFHNITAPILGFTYGDKIYGRLSVSQDSQGEQVDRDGDLQSAHWLRVDSPTSEKHQFHFLDSIVIKRADVAISIQVKSNPYMAKMLKMGEDELMKYRESIFDID